MSYYGTVFDALPKTYLAGYFNSIDMYLYNSSPLNFQFDLGLRNFRRKNKIPSKGPYNGRPPYGT